MSAPEETSRDETGNRPMKAGATGGRSRRWGSAAEKHRARRARQARKAALGEDLLHAVRNAELDDAALQRVVNEGDDAAVLEGLIAAYQARNWNLLRWQRSKQAKSEEP